MIPKKIHFVWVGTQTKSDLILNCIESWKKHLPNYEIIEWDNSKFDKIKNAYSQQAFEYKKWAFVSDYIRLYALYHEGGIYLDTDVEITQNIDKFLEHNFFTGYEDYNGRYSPVTALMGATKGNKIIRDLLSYYETASFVKPTGLDVSSNTSRISGYFDSHYNLKKPYNGSVPYNLDAQSKIYPSFFFCTPISGKENYSIHHFNGSWLDAYSRRNKFSLWGFTLVRFRKNLGINSDVLPLYDREKLLFSFKAWGAKVFGVIKNQ